MLLPFSIRVTECPPVWERAVHSVLLVRVFRGPLSNFVCTSFPFGIGGEMWDVIVLITDHCLSFYFSCSGISVLLFLRVLMFVLS